MDTTLHTLRELQGEIDQAMQAFFASSIAQSSVQDSRHAKTALGYIEEFSQRPGKRLRGALTVVAYEGCGGGDKKLALQAAVAIELVQNYLLIIDDVMDKAALRRGEDTIHKVYAKSLRTQEASDVDHLADMLAVNVGALTQHLASLLLSQVAADAPSVLLATQRYHRNVLATGYGQIEDLYSQVDRERSEGDILRTYRMKSSYYTFINPLQVGAALAGSEEVHNDVIEKMGIPAGLAFQIQDDVIGLFGDKSASGKPNMDDLKEGKMTLMMQHAIEHAGKADANVIRSCLGNPEVTAEQHQRVCDIVESCGAKHYAVERARAYASEAQLHLSELEWSESSKQFLSNIIQYSVERTV